MPKRLEGLKYTGPCSDLITHPLGFCDQIRIRQNSISSSSCRITHYRSGFDCAKGSQCSSPGRYVSG